MNLPGLIRGRIPQSIGLYLNAKARGLSVIFITHNVHHVMAVADRYSIIRHGQKVGTYAKGEITFDDISDLITASACPDL
jgi:simple sugar transport system ATP-binding protein